MEKLYLKPFTLNNGYHMPLIGYGTFKTRGDALVEQLLDFALSAGYRLIDTAVVYCNEESIGRALHKLLPKYKIKREQIFVTSKIPPNTEGNKNKIQHHIKNSLINLQLNYIDLYLVHWPGQQGKPPNADDNEEVRDKIWEALVEAQQRGWVKSIGVSNYTAKHLSQLIANNHGVMPAVNQIEWHPLCHQEDIMHLCKQHRILLQAYCSLGGSDDNVLLQEPTVIQVSQRAGKPAAKVLLAWALQQDVAIIPKSTTEDHIRDNLDFDFKLSASDLKLLNNLPQKRFAWDPTVVT